MISFDTFSDAISSINNVNRAESITSLSDSFIDFMSQNICSLSVINDYLDNTNTSSVFLNHNTVLNSLNSIIPIQSSKKGYI